MVGTSYAVFDALRSTPTPSRGSRMVAGTEVFTSASRTRGGAPRCRPWTADPRRAGGRDVDGWTFATPVVEMPVYLAWLVGRVETLGGTVTRLNLGALPSGRRPGRQLLGPGRPAAGVRPVGGAGARPGGVRRADRRRRGGGWTARPPTYVVPRSNDIVVGGTDDEGEWSRTPSPETAEAILRRAAVWCPECAAPGCSGTRSACGRCGPPVRLERVGDVVHCYGHGGAGVTLSWGVADEVVSLA